jgi:hypothetical protein
MENESTAAAVQDQDQDHQALDHQVHQDQGAVPPGIVRIIGDLPIGAVITEAGLATMFSRCQLTIKRAIERGELPRPIRLMGQPTWTAGAIVDHLNRRLREAQREHKDLDAKADKLRP